MRQSSQAASAHQRLACAGGRARTDERNGEADPSRRRLDPREEEHQHHKDGRERLEYLRVRKRLV